MRSRLSLLLLAAAIVLLGSLAADAVMASSQLSISGVVWFDENADGIRQPAEPGMPFIPLELGKITGSGIAFRDAGGLPLFRDDAGRSVRPDANGAYSYPNLEPGSYVLRIASFGNPYFLTHPFRRGTGEYGVSVGLTTESATNVNFGLHLPLDVPSFSGEAWIDAESVVADVRALIDGVDCTTRLLLPPVHHARYGVAVVSAGLIPGCGEPGKIIRFSLNGRLAHETAIWLPRTFGSPSGNPQHLDLTVGPPFAVFSLEPVSREEFSFVPAGVVEAFVDGRLCGQSERSGTRIVVPSREIAPGCGVEGSIVTFALIVDGIRIGEAIWSAGFHDGPSFVWPPHPVLRQGSEPSSQPIRPPDTGSGGLVRAR